jgi:uncharacterized protein YdcH (DUF465 family)
MPAPRPQGSGSDTHEERVVDSAWTRLQGHLRVSRDTIQDEIRNYPTPIAGCDQQFNHLLERRDQIDDEISRIDEAILNHQPHVIADLVRSSDNVDQGLKATLMAGLAVADD